MKLNIAFPARGTCKQFEITEEVLRHINMADYSLGKTIEGKLFGDEYAGYTFRIQGGSDKEGFPMMHGVAQNSRVSLLLPRGACGFQAFRGRNGERRRKSVRGMILANDVAALNVVIVNATADAKPITGVTDETPAKRLGGKRANTIRKLFNLEKTEEVKGYLKRKVTKAGKKDRVKQPRIQRLVTSSVRAMRTKKCKNIIIALKKSAEERREYLTLISRQRLVKRQRKNALKHRQKVAAEKAVITSWKKAGSPKMHSKSHSKGSTKVATKVSAKK